MNEAEIQRQKEIKEAEELLFTGPQVLGFAKGLFLGQFVADWAMPYPRIPAAQQVELDKSLAEVREFLDRELDPVAIDREADIPRHAFIEGRINEAMACLINSAQLIAWSPTMRTSVSRSPKPTKPAIPHI